MTLVSFCNTWRYNVSSNNPHDQGHLGLGHFISYIIPTNTGEAVLPNDIQNIFSFIRESASPAQPQPQLPQPQPQPCQTHPWSSTAQEQLSVHAFCPRADSWHSDSPGSDLETSGPPTHNLSFSTPLEILIQLAKLAGLCTQQRVLKHMDPRSFDE
jgi:hypothetical protein